MIIVLRLVMVVGCYRILLIGLGVSFVGVLICWFRGRLVMCIG